MNSGLFFSTNIIEETSPNGSFKQYTKNAHKRKSIMCCVCVLSSNSFWTSMDVPAGVTQEEGHTGFFIHLLSAVRALIFLARRIQPFLSDTMHASSAYSIPQIARRTHSSAVSGPTFDGCSCRWTRSASMSASLLNLSSTMRSIGAKNTLNSQTPRCRSVRSTVKSNFVY